MSSYSDDPASPAAPFSGDGTGQIFDTPDMVAVSPTTDERVVDTQSGFLVVVKRIGDRLALSIKRRVGTPPSSSINLTPDESLKLSKILAVDYSGRVGAPERLRRRNRTIEEGEQLPDWASGASSFAVSQLTRKVMLAGVLRAYFLPIAGISLIVIATAFGAGFTTKSISGSAASPAVQEPNPLSAENVDKFVRVFVASMLDFSPSTYRASQIQAMAAMKPELMQRYWQETKFPLTDKQLKHLPQGVTILITELKQEPLADDTVRVDVHAQLTDPKNPKIATPVSLRLMLGTDFDNRIQVREQEDLSAVNGR